MERTSTRGIAPPRQPSRARRRLKKRALLMITLAGGLVVWSAAMSGCGRADEDAAGKAPANNPRPPAVATAPPPVFTAQPTTNPALPQQSYLFFQYSNGDGQDALGAALAAGAEDPNATATQWGIPKAFPQARLMLTDKKDGPVTARLFSDDPEEALSQKWSGDRYYLEMRLQAESIAHLDGERWGVTASAGEIPETTNGIYLKGDRYHLVPVDVVVTFEGQAPNIKVRLDGHFLQTDSTEPMASPKKVFVQGVVMPRVETK
jgi:hypothetical protein